MTVHSAPESVSVAAILPLEAASVPRGVACSRHPECTQEAWGSVPGGPAPWQRVTSAWRTPASCVTSARPLRVERCFNLSSDDDHFSPEADAAIIEMTGYTALLAQVCGAGGLVGLSQEPPPGASSLSELSWLLVSRPIAPAFPWPTP